MPKNNRIIRLWSLIPFIFIFQYSCKDTTEKFVENATETTTTSIEILPFKKLDLSNLSAFQKTTLNWKTVGDAYVDRTKPKTITGTDGTGVLLNVPSEENKKPLFTNFIHGDIEMEIDVMMPVGSNSGLYFQGRYETNQKSFLHLIPLFTSDKSSAIHAY